MTKRTVKKDEMESAIAEFDESGSKSEHRDWLLHAYTKRCASKFVIEEDRAMRTLLVACRDSSDPRVQSAYGNLCKWRGILSFCMGEKQ